MSNGDLAGMADGQEVAAVQKVVADNAMSLTMSMSMPQAQMEVEMAVDNMFGAGEGMDIDIEASSETLGEVDHIGEGSAVSGGVIGGEGDNSGTGNEIGGRPLLSVSTLLPTTWSGDLVKLTQVRTTTRYVHPPPKSHTTYSFIEILPYFHSYFSIHP